MTAGRTDSGKVAKSGRLCYTCREMKSEKAVVDLLLNIMRGRKEE